MFCQGVTGVKRRVLLLVPLLLAGFYGVAAAQAAAYTVTVTQPSHGTISPLGTVSVNNDPFHPTTFTITPDPGYTVADVQTAGVSQGGTTSFTYYGIWYNTTLAATIIPTPNSTPETIYVDNQLTTNITDGTYSIANRSGGGSDGNAYKSIGGACDVAGPGDTVYIRGGDYNSASPTPGDVVWPRVSGTAANPILIKSYPGETAAIIGSTNGAFPIDLRLSIARCPISMRNVSYITVDGLTIDGTAGWSWIGFCHHITIQNCTFRSSTWGSKGTFRFHFSSYCTLKNCTFANSAYDATLLMNSNHIVVDGCTWRGKFGHTNLSLRSASWCVVRNNRFRNGLWTGTTSEKLTEVFDQKLDLMDPLNPSYTPVPGYNSTQHNLFEYNWYGYHPDASREANIGSRCSAIQFSGQRTIIRRNVFSNPPLDPPDPNGGTAGGVGIVWRWGGSFDGFNWNGNTLTQAGSSQGHEAGFVWGNRVYNNTFYGNDMGHMTFPVDNAMGSTPDPPPMKNVADWQNYPFTDHYRFNDNVIVNNILAGCVIYYRRNLTYIVQCEGMPVQMFLVGRRPYTFWKTNDFFGVAGGSRNDNLIMDQVDYPYQAPQTPAWYNANVPANFTGNVQYDPHFVSLPTAPVEGSGDFHLLGSSAVIDAGQFLTTITTAAGSGTTFTVADPNYFYDGYGISGEQGDLIKLRNGQTARITRINYGNGTITLDRAVSWSQGEGVSLNYEGTAPDLGAFEYVIRPITDLAVSSVSQNSATVTWTVPGQQGVAGTAATYDIRYAGSSLTEANWETAAQVQGEPIASPLGQQQSFTITGLNPGTTYHVAVKILDEGRHVSVLSNGASGTTATTGNHAPVLMPIGDRSVLETETLTFPISATDADNDPLTYSATNLPAGATFTAATRTFTWTPTSLQRGRYQVMFQVSDTRVSVSETITITVRRLSNQAPVLAAIGDKSTNEGTSLDFTLSATDADGDPLVFSATGLPRGASLVNGVFRWTPNYDQAGSYPATFTVSDGELTDSEQITIVVANATDQTPPSAHDFWPAAEAFQVPPNTLIAMTISDGGLGVDASSVAIRVNNQLVYTGNTSIYQSASGTCRRVGTPASYRYYFQPARPFDFDQHVSVAIAASDIARNAMTPVSYQFATEMRSFGRNQPISTDGDASGRPALATDSQGNLWATWHAGSANARDIYVAMRDSQVQGWNTPLRLASMASDRCNPALAIGSDNVLYLAWQDNRRGNWDIYVSASADGATWGDPIRVTDSNDNQMNPVIAVDQASPYHVYIAWERGNIGSRDIYLASCSSSLISKTIARVTSDPADQAEPALAVGSGNTIYLLWTDQRNGSADIYGSSSAASSWSNTAVVTGPGDQSHPAVAVAPGSAVLHIVWQNDAAGNLDVLYGTSTGLPASPFPGSSLIDDTTGGDQFAPSIMAAKDHANNVHVYACWQDNRAVGGTQDSDLYVSEVRAGVGGTNILVGDDGTNSNQSDPALGYDEYGQPAVVWTDSRSSVPRIYGACSSYFKPMALASALIARAAGGTVGVDPAAIRGAGDVSIQIPAGACDGDVVITISEIQNPPSFATSSVVGYEIGPSGVQFSLPATVTIPYAGSGTDQTAPYWYDALTATLSQQGMTEITHRTLANGIPVVAFKTTHLTTFYILESPLAAGSSGGGGCALSHAPGGDIAGSVFPYVALTLLLLATKWRDRRRPRGC